jgi:hypothetical protein
MLRILTTVLLLLVLILGVAWWREWFTVGVTHPGDDRTDIEVAVHRDKFNEDVNRLRKGVEKPAPNQTKGTLTAVDVNQKKIEVGADKGAVSFTVNDGTEIHIGGRPAALADLRPGMKVTVGHAASDGPKLAQSIHVEREAP